MCLAFHAFVTFCSEWQHPIAATPQENFKARLSVESQRSWKSIIHSPASLLTLLPHTNLLGCPAFGPGLTHPVLKLPQVEIREQM